MEEEEDKWTFGQQLLEAKLRACSEEECETILRVYKEIQEEKKMGRDCWFSLFVKPLKTFVNWHNNQLQKQQQPKEWKVNNNQARAVLDKIDDEKHD